MPKFLARKSRTCVAMSLLHKANVAFAKFITGDVYRRLAKVGARMHVLTGRAPCRASTSMPRCASIGAPAMLTSGCLLDLLVLRPYCSPRRPAVRGPVY